MENLNILLVSTQDYLHHPIPSRHHNIFEELATRHTVHVPHFHISDGPTRDTRLEVHEATLFPVKNPVLHYTMNAPYHYLTIRDILRRYDIDVIVGAHVLAGTAMVRAAKDYGVPVIFDLKDWFPDSAAAYYKNAFIRKTIHDTVAAITAYNLDNSDVITTVSPGLMKKLHAWRGYTPRLITNGANTDYFKPMSGASVRKRLGIPDDAPVIGFAGAVERWYALDQVIRAFSTLLKQRPDAYLLIVGDALFTRYKADLQDLVIALRLEHRVMFTGAVEYVNLPEYIAAMDVCLIPLLPEQWIDIALPNKYFEYSACGKPILSTPIPDVIDMNEGNVYIYRDYKTDFIRKINDILNADRQYHINVEQHSWKRKAEAFENIFKEAVI
ncbi:MAG: glycosyltransferase [Bacteroidales bacterium]|jgi:glycosyltransferase involved in cell wall biosynthesis